MMIENNFKIEKKEASEIKPIPEGMYQAKIKDINSEERPTYDTKTLPKEEHVMENVFSVEYELLNGEEAGKSLVGHSLYKNFVPGYFYISRKNGKNALYQVVESALARELSPEEEVTFEASKMNELIGKEVIIGVKNTTKDGTTYSNIEQLYKAQSQPQVDVAKELEQSDIPTINVDDDIKIEDIPF